MEILGYCSKCCMKPLTLKCPAACTAQWVIKLETTAVKYSKSSGISSCLTCAGSVKNLSHIALAENGRLWLGF